jgi:thioredoxin
MLSDRHSRGWFFSRGAAALIPDPITVFCILAPHPGRHLTGRTGFLYVAGNDRQPTLRRECIWRPASVANKAFPEFDEGNFDAEVLGRPGLTVVDFWAEWCVPCKQMARLLGELVDELPEGVRVGKVDADANRALVDRYGVRAIPSLLFFKDGVLVEARTGVDRRQVLKKAIEAHA